LPIYSKFLFDRFTSLPLLNEFIPVELCNLKYESQRAACIEPHIDDTWLWGDRLITLNLMSNTFLTLTSKQNPYQNTIIFIPLKQRSLLVLSDEARYEWLHEINKSHIKSTRYAISE
jgi:alkylated DNA repair protein alkB family protein 4